MKKSTKTRKIQYFFIFLQICGWISMLYGAIIANGNIVEISFISMVVTLFLLLYSEYFYKQGQIDALEKRIEYKKIWPNPFHPIPFCTGEPYWVMKKDYGDK